MVKAISEARRKMQEAMQELFLDDAFYDEFEKHIQEELLETDCTIYVAGGSADLTLHFGSGDIFRSVKLEDIEIFVERDNTDEENLPAIKQLQQFITRLQQTVETEKLFGKNK